jgi:multidrug efflux pump subunit AcrB
VFKHFNFLYYWEVFLHTLKCKTSLFRNFFPKIKVIADAGQQPVDKMMVTVTKPLKMQSKNSKSKTVQTSRGSCEISAFVDWNADLDVSKQQIESRINQIRTDLPLAFK